MRWEEYAAKVPRPKDTAYGPHCAMTTERLSFGGAGYLELHCDQAARSLRASSSEEWISVEQK
jgi:hypothetical protein